MLHDRVLTEQAILPVPFSVARSGFVLCPEPPLAIGLDEASRLFSAEIPDSDSPVELSVRWGDLSSVRRDSSVYDSGGSWALRRGDGTSDNGRSGDWIYDFYTPVFGPTPFRSARIREDFSGGEIVLERGFYGIETPEALGFPLAELLFTQLLAREGGVEFHGCGIRLEDGRGVLLVGHSGAGKTTTANLWSGAPGHLLPLPDLAATPLRKYGEGTGERSASGITILSDDRIIVRASSGSENFTPALQPHPVLTDTPLRKYGEGTGERSAAGVRHRLYGTPWHGEGRYAANLDAPLAAIFVLEHGAETRAIRLSGADAVTALFSRAFPPFYDPGAVEAVLATIDGIASVVPVYQFPFVPDRTAIEMVRSLVANVPPHPGPSGLSLSLEGEGERVV